MISRRDSYLAEEISRFKRLAMANRRRTQEASSEGEQNDRQRSAGTANEGATRRAGIEYDLCTT